MTQQETSHEKIFKNENFSAQTIPTKEFSDCSFINCSFDTSIFQSTTFIDCRFESCIFSNTQIDGCSFQDVSFQNCKFLGISKRIDTALGVSCFTSEMLSVWKVFKLNFFLTKVVKLCF